MTKRCGLCGFSSEDPTLFANHVRVAHAWDQVVAERQARWIHPAIVIVLILLMPIGWAILGVLSLRHADRGLDIGKPDHALALLAIPFAISFWFWGPPLAGAPHDDQGLGTALLMFVVTAGVVAVIGAARLLRSVFISPAP